MGSEGDIGSCRICAWLHSDGTVRAWNSASGGPTGPSRGDWRDRPHPDGCSIEAWIDGERYVALGKPSIRDAKGIRLSRLETLDPEPRYKAGPR